MCLTVCRATETIYDNDRTYVCSTCSLKTRKDESQVCDTCKHFREGANGGNYCALTSMSIPQNRWCCHWNAPSSLSYYPHSLNNVDGIVLVTSDQFEEALQDYEHCLKSVENNISLEELLETDDFFDALEPVDDDPIAIINNNEADNFYELEQIALAEIEKKSKYQRVTREDTNDRVYVPIVVGDALVHHHGGIEGVVRWFEAIFGGKEDILLDWKNRWIVKPHRFAVPAVYGVPSPEWSNYIDDDVTSLIHELFS